jgi:hypothetical protein
MMNYAMCCYLNYVLCPMNNLCLKHEFWFIYIYWFEVLCVSLIEGDKLWNAYSIRDITLVCLDNHECRKISAKTLILYMCAIFKWISHAYVGGSTRTT